MQLQLMDLLALSEKQTQELSEVKANFAQGESKVQALEGEKSKLGEELNRTRTEASQRESNVLAEMNQVRAELSHTQEELDAVLGSVSYNALRFFTKRIDQLFPDNTWPGRLRKRVVSRLRRDRKPRDFKNTNKAVPQKVRWSDKTRKLGRGYS